VGQSALGPYIDWAEIAHDGLLKRYLDSHLPADHFIFERSEPDGSGMKFFDEVENIGK
jgi:hypothetical protein